MTSIPSLPTAASPPDREPPDDALVDRVVRGEKTAFSTLMRRYNQRVFRTVRSVVKNDAEAEDIAQQAWLAAYRALGSFRGEASFPTWLGRIAFNEALAHVRKTRRRELVALDAGGAMATGERSPEEAASSRETARLIERHLDLLPENVRTVLVLRDVEELTSAETAAILGISDGAVRVRLHRARQLLQSWLSETVQVGMADAFHFDGERCDRIVHGVMARL